MDLYLHTFGLRYNYKYNDKFDVFAFLDLAAARGFRGVNISVYRPDYKWLSGSGADHLPRVRAHAERRGLSIDIESNGTSQAALAELFEFAVALGAGAVRTYTTPDGAQHWQDWPRGQDSVAERSAMAVRDLVQAARLAEQCSIPIVLENHEELTGSENAEILASVDSPWVCALFDYGNSMVNGEEPLTALQSVAPWIKTAHVKDQVFVPTDEGGASGQLIGVPIGYGSLPVREMTERLLSLGVGRVCIENCWGYSTPVDDWRGGARPGTGAFAGRRSTASSGTPSLLVPDASQLPAAELPAAEIEMLDASIAGFEDLLAGVAEITLGEARLATRANEASLGRG
ncbi:MAG TPA: TIM barrel protein [Acidimicrobiales bacterium]|nr:TIM barrel protein [Acidimicrobiales bacterium]